MTALQERYSGALAELREIGDILAETLGYGDYAGAGDHTPVTLAIEARERVWVLEAALIRVLGDCYEIYDADGNEYRDEIVLALAKAGTKELFDPDHSPNCDVNTSPHGDEWEKVTICTCRAVGGERRGR